MVTNNKSKYDASVEFLRGHETAEELISTIEHDSIEGPNEWAGFITGVLACFYFCSPDFEIGDKIVEFAKDCAKERVIEHEREQETA
jgi:hypothetical protein